MDSRVSRKAGPAASASSMNTSMRDHMMSTNSPEATEDRSITSAMVACFSGVWSPFMPSRSSPFMISAVRVSSLRRSGKYDSERSMIAGAMPSRKVSRTAFLIGANSSPICFTALAVFQVLSPSSFCALFRSSRVAFSSFRTFSASETPPMAIFTTVCVCTKAAMSGANCPMLPKSLPMGASEALAALPMATMPVMS